MSNQKKPTSNDHWLRQESLELKRIINLARGAPVTDWPPDSEWGGIFRDLKHAIGRGELVAARHDLGRFDSVRLADLWPFLTKPERRDDARWEPLRDFCRRWGQVRRVSLPEPRQSPVATAGAETRCRDWLEGEVAAWAQGFNPPLPRKANMRQTALAKFEGLSRRGFQRAWDQIAPSEWKRPGPKSSR